MESSSRFSGTTCPYGQNAHETSIPGTNANSGKENPGLDVKKIKESVERGYRKIEEAKTCKQSVIILGKTGVGKSTLVNGLIGNKLVCVPKPAYEEEPSSGDDSSDNSGKGQKRNDYYLETGDSPDGSSQIAEIGHTSKSQTTVPGAFTDDKTGVVYYDCPGFGDTKGVEQDTANSLYIKRILDRSEEVKLLYIVDHASTLVSRGVELINILKTISYFNSEEVKNSIGIIVSKAPGEYRRSDLVNSFKELAKDLGGQEDSETSLTVEQAAFAKGIKKSMIGVAFKPTKPEGYVLDERVVKLVHKTLGFVRLKTIPLIIGAESVNAVRRYHDSAAEEIKHILAEFSSVVTQGIAKRKNDRIETYKYVCENDKVITGINDAKAKDVLGRPDLIGKVHPGLLDILGCIEYTKEIAGGSMSVPDLLNFQEITRELSQWKQDI